MRLSRSDGLFVLFALIVASAVTRGLVERPGFTDAFYHYNAAERIVAGQGFTDTYLWVFIGAPETLPESGVYPSHLYWMPFTSISAAVGMWLFGESYGAAQLPFTLMYAAAAMVAYWLGGRLGGTNRHRWTAGLLTLFSGFFIRWWGTIDTFAPYALFGALALVFTGLGTTALYNRAESWRMSLFFFLAGVCAGVGHLTRADGVLLMMVAGLVIVWAMWDSRRMTTQHGLALTALVIGYVLVMTPWFLRNLDAIGALLPLGGSQAIWLTEYNDLFAYPASASPDLLFADGLGTFIDSRWEAFLNNLGTFIAVEGLVILTPLMVIGVWVRRHDKFVRAFWVYALGLHVVMTLVFPYPGYRGGLFHSASALVPWWAALGVVGLDASVDWVAKRRRTWKPRGAKRVFTIGLVVLALVLSFQFAAPVRDTGNIPSLYRTLMETLPQDARVMINDPAQLYYYTGMGGTVTPQSPPEMIPEIAQRYRVTHLLVQYSEASDGRIAYAIPDMLVFDLDDPPEFLTEIEINVSGARLYAIDEA